MMELMQRQATAAGNPTLETFDMTARNNLDAFDLMIRWAITPYVSMPIPHLNCAMNGLEGYRRDQDLTVSHQMYR